ncbi:MAG: hypothetical protein ACO271_13995, partial [Burkholderiales bacterium]
ERNQATYPSTVAYVACLILHRFARLGILDENGAPLTQMGILEAPERSNEPKVMKGSRCPECGNATLIRKDGCDWCSACGYTGTCG